MHGSYFQIGDIPRPPLKRKCPKPTPHKIKVYSLFVQVKIVWIQNISVVWASLQDPAEIVMPLIIPNSWIL